MFISDKGNHFFSPRSATITQMLIGRRAGALRKNHNIFKTKEMYKSSFHFEDIVDRLVIIVSFTVYVRWGKGGGVLNCISQILLVTLDVSLNHRFTFY